MTTGIVILVLAVIVALVGLHVLWDSWRSGRAFCTPLPPPYRNRDSQEAVWRDRCGDLRHATGVRHDPCVIDVFIAAVRFMGGEKPKPWWKYTPERKRTLTAKTTGRPQ